MARPIIILSGLSLALLLAYFCVNQHIDEIPRDIQNRSYEALLTKDMDAIGVTVDGRDITLSGIVEKAKAKQRAEEIVEDVNGVRSVENNIMVVPKSLPDPQEVVVVPELTTEDINQQCETDIAAALKAQPIQFKFGSTSLNEESIALLQTIAEIARNCPDSSLTVEAHTDRGGNEDANVVISQRRAEAIASYLRETAELPHNINAEGFGSKQPVATDATNAQQAQHRRIEIKLNSKKPASLEDK